MAMEGAMKVVCRRSDVEDSDAILSVVSDDASGYRQRWGLFDVQNLIETSYLSITALAVRADGTTVGDDPPPIVGFAAFSDTPVSGEYKTAVSGEAWVQWAVSGYDLPGCQLTTTVWLSLLVADERAGYGADVMDAVMRTAFTTLPHVDYALVLPPTSTGLFPPLDADKIFSSAVTTNAAALEANDPTSTFRQAAVLVSARENMIPTLRVRRAAVEDHDDLVPIFNSQSEVLTEQYGEFFLAELIEAQDDVHRALVAEVDGAAVGLMAVSARVDVSLLSRCFDLSSFNNLVNRSLAEQAAADRADRAAVRSRRDWLTTLDNHSDDVSALLDALSGQSGDGTMTVRDVEKAFDGEGVLWGFENVVGVRHDDAVPAAGVPLGACMLSELGLTVAADRLTRDAFNDAVSAYRDARARKSRRRRLQDWYQHHHGRDRVLEAFAAVESAVVVAPVAGGDSKSPDDGDEETKDGGDAGPDAGAAAGAGAGGGDAGADGGADGMDGPLAGAAAVSALTTYVDDQVYAEEIEYRSPTGAGPADELFQELKLLVGADGWKQAAIAAPTADVDADVAAGTAEGGDGDAGAAAAAESKDGGVDEDGKAATEDESKLDGGGDDAAAAVGGAGADGAEPTDALVTQQPTVEAVTMDTLEAALDAWESSYVNDGRVRIAITGNALSGKRSLAAALSEETGLAVIDVGAVVDAANAAAEEAAKRAADEEAARQEAAKADADAAREAGEEVADEDDIPASVTETPSASQQEDASRFSGPFAAVLEQLVDGEEFEAGFILVNIPGMPADRKGLLEGLKSEGMSLDVELSTIATQEVAATRTASSSELSMRAAVYRRDTAACAQDPSLPPWAPVRIELDADPSLADVTTASLDALHRRGILVDPQEVADAEAEAEGADGGGGASSASTASTPNAFSITLFCVEDVFESRSQDFLHHAFATFPDREYCVLTLPHMSAETALLSRFSLATPASDSTFEHVLYIAHRASLLSPSDLVVRRASPADRPQVLSLVSSLPNRAALLGAVANAETHAEKELDDDPSTAAFVAVLAGQVVGVAVYSSEDASPGHVAALREGFELDVYLPDSALFTKSRGSSGPGTPMALFLQHFAMNPIFAASSRDLIRHSLRLFGGRQTVLSRLLSADAASDVSPVIVDEFIQIAPRRLVQLRPGELPVLFTDKGDAHQLTAGQLRRLQQAAEETGGDGGDGSGSGSGSGPVPFSDPACNPRSLDHSLFFLTRKLCSEPKIRVNSRIVVVGASDTGLSALQSLLLVPYLDFTNVTLVSVGGLPPDEDDVGAAAASGAAPFLPDPVLSPFDLARLAFAARVRVVDGAMVALDRESKSIGLPDGSIIPYDVLLLTAGLTEPTPAKVGYATEEDWPSALCSLSNHAAAQRAASAAERLAVGGGRGALDGGVRDVLVYGTSVEALSGIAALTMRGISGGRIVFAHSAGEGQLPALRVDDSEASAVMETRVLAQLEAMGVEVLPNATLTSLSDGGDMGGDSIATLTNKETGDVLREAPFALVVTGDRRNVDKRFFGAVNDAGLVYDGRLVVDHTFVTADRNIFASGTVTKFARRYRAPKWLEHYNSKELGAALARSVLARLDPLRSADGVDADVGFGSTGGADTFPSRAGPSTLPQMFLPRRTCAVLPGPMQFLHVALAEYQTGKSGGDFMTRAKPSEGETKANGVEVERTCRAVVDQYGRLASFTYLGQDFVETDNLTTVVGRHESQLNALSRDFTAGRIPDLIGFFRADWSGLLFTDRFPALTQAVDDTLMSDPKVQSLLESIADAVEKQAGDKVLARKRQEGVGQAGASLPPSTRRAIELHILEHLRDQGALLPMYFVPGRK